MPADTARQIPKIEKMFLHVGCGWQRKANTTRGFNSDQWGEIRFDIDPSVAPDIVGTMTDMSAVASGSIDAIYSSHNIEHVYPHEVAVVLAEFLRVLKDDGFAVITCPDLKSVAKRIADDFLTEPAYQSPAGPIAPLDMLYGYRLSLARGDLYMAHKCGFTEKVLTEVLHAAKFKSVGTVCIPQNFALWALASKPERGEAELRELARLHFS